MWMYIFKHILEQIPCGFPAIGRFYHLFHFIIIPCTWQILLSTLELFKRAKRVWEVNIVLYQNEFSILYLFWYLQMEAVKQ